jgi:hypothetical protein
MTTRTIDILRNPGDYMGDFGLALTRFVLLTVWQAPPLLMVALGALGGIGLTLSAS